MVYCDLYKIKMAMIDPNVGDVAPITKGHYNIFFYFFILTITTMRENDLNFGHFH